MALGLFILLATHHIELQIMASVVSNGTEYILLQPACESRPRRLRLPSDKHIQVQNYLADC